LGHQALNLNTTGSTNTAIGQGAYGSNTTGNQNVAIGYLAGNNGSTQSCNVVVGSKAAQGITTGDGHNICIGFMAGFYNTNLTEGKENILIGAYTSNTAADGDAAICIGYGAYGTSGYTTLGRDTADIRTAHGSTSWATVSDERMKKDIVDSTVGLSFVNALRPRTFKYKNKGDLPDTFQAYKADSTEVFKNSTTNHGFIAQEVKTAIDAESGIKDGFKLWDDRPDGSQEVAEAALIPVLVKAIQELSAENKALLTRIEALETPIA